MSKYRIKLDGKVYELEIERVDGGGQAAVPARAPKPAEPAVKPVQAAPAAEKAPEASESAVKSPMPGTILRVNAAAGDAVKKGQSVLVLEAMKMENDIAAPRDGKLTAMYVAKGDTVQGGAPLFEIG